MSGDGRKVVTEGLEILMWCLDGAVEGGWLGGDQWDKRSHR